MKGNFYLTILSVSRWGLKTTFIIYTMSVFQFITFKIVDKHYAHQGMASSFKCIRQIFYYLRCSLGVRHDYQGRTKQILSNKNQTLFPRVTIFPRNEDYKYSLRRSFEFEISFLFKTRASKLEHCWFIMETLNWHYANQRHFKVSK